MVLGDFASYVTADALDGGNAQVVEGTPDDWWFPDIDFDGNFVSFKAPSGLWEVRSLKTGNVIYEAPAGWSIRGVNSDGTKAVINDSATLSVGRVRLVSTGDGSAIDLAVPGVGPARFSADGKVVALGNSGDLNMPVISTEDGQLLADFGVFGETPYGGAGISFSPDSTKLILGSIDGGLSVHDLETMLSGAPVDETVDLDFDAHDHSILRTVVSPDGTMATSAAFSEPLRLWGLSDGQLLGEFGSGGAEGVHLGDFHPTRDWLLVTSPPNEVRIHTLDIDELIAIAEARLSRVMTEAECERYFGGPCPTP